MRGMRETVQTVINQVAELVGGYVPNLLGALGILVVGWLVALIVGRIVPWCPQANHARQSAGQVDGWW